MKSVELFAGGGGLALGAERAGFEHLAVLERDSDSCAALKLNRGTVWPVHQVDVCDFDYSSLAGKVDLVSGGPPCQPFSIGGKHAGFQDSRDMFPEAVRAIRNIQPKAFVFENVRGLLRKSFTTYFNYILLQLQHPEVSRKADEQWEDHLVRLERHHTGGKLRGLQYRVMFQLVNAANYGIAQKRERVVIVGFRADLPVRWSFPAATHSETELQQSKWTTGEYWDLHRVSKSKRTPPPEGFKQWPSLDSLLPKPKRWLTVRDAISDLPDPRESLASGISNHRFQPGAKAYTGHTGSPLDEPAKTLKAGDHGVPGGENMMVLPDGSVRYFTVRESARLQSFPDDYRFISSWTESMRQIGNAVPVRLAHVMVGSVAQALRHLPNA